MHIPDQQEWIVVLGHDMAFRDLCGRLTALFDQFVGVRAPSGLARQCGMQRALKGPLGGLVSCVTAGGSRWLCDGSERSCNGGWRWVCNGSGGLNDGSRCSCDGSWQLAVGSWQPIDHCTVVTLAFPPELLNMACTLAPLEIPTSCNAPPRGDGHLAQKA